MKLRGARSPCHHAPCIGLVVPAHKLEDVTEAGITEDHLECGAEKQRLKLAAAALTPHLLGASMASMRLTPRESVVKACKGAPASGLPCPSPHLDAAGGGRLWNHLPGHWVISAGLCNQRQVRQGDQ